MKRHYILLTTLLFLFAGLIGYADRAKAAAIATMPNRAGGKIVLTDEACVHKGKTYDGLARAYNYSTEGYTTEGCFAIEDETVVVIWNDGSANSKMRYPAENFTIIKKKGTRYGT